MTPGLGQRADVAAPVRERVDGAWQVDRRSAPTDPRYLRLVTAAVEDGPAGRWAIAPDEEGVWLRAEPAGALRRPQGWKLHVSASLPDDEAVLRAVLPHLLSAGVPWKVAASRAVLSGLNQGEAGMSQVGKFLTVYPADDVQAVELAVLLDAATRGMSGPAVPSDRRIRRGSLVSYRFGGFDDRVVEAEHGELLPAVSAPDGTLEPDRRGTAFAPPSWATDPFEAAGLGEPLDRRRLVADRYVLTATLARSPRGAVHGALDLTTGRPCVLKHAVAGAARSPRGGDALSALRGEHAILTTLGAHPALPAVLALEDEGDQAWLVLEQVPGRPVGQAVAAQVNSGHSPDVGAAIAWTAQVAEALEHVHAHGLVYRDVKPGNVLLTSDGTVRLIDFELALPMGSPGDGTLGSRGYCSPQQVAGDPAAASDDVYGLGALLYLLLTGAEPAIAPDPFALTARPVSDLNAGVPDALADVVVRCLSLEPQQRYPSARSAAAAAAEAARSPSRQVGERIDHTDRRDVAARLADSLTRSVQRWSTGAVPMARLDSSLYSGTAGELFVLAHLVDRLTLDHLRAPLAAAAARMIDLPAGTYRGLYQGEAGIGVALVRAGCALGDPGIVDAGADRVAWAVAAPAEGLDVVSGVAGQVRACLLVATAVPGTSLLGRAVALASQLVDRAEQVPDGVRWSGDGPPVLGYAHGVAGIADALLDVAEAADDLRCLETARSATRYLERQARALPGDGSAAAWSDVEGGTGLATMWCHGATGIAQFLLHAAAAVLTPSVGQVAAAALRTVAGARATLGPVLCHGLAGSLQLLLDAGPLASADDVAALTRLLDAFAVDDGTGLVFVGDAPTEAPPALSTGYGGVALTQLRLGDRREAAPLAIADAARWGQRD